MADTQNLNWLKDLAVTNNTSTSGTTTPAVATPIPTAPPATPPVSAAPKPLATTAPIVTAPAPKPEVTTAAVKTATTSSVAPSTIYTPPATKTVTDPTGAQRNVTTNADGTQTATNVPNAPTAPAGDTFENRNNPNSAWVYYGNGEWRNDKTGETKNTAPAATATTAPSQNDYLSKWGLSPEEIDKNLAAEKSAIMQKYQVQKEQAATKTENERKANLSSLYSVGEVNPLSSGVGNMDQLSSRNLDSRNAALDAEMAAEINDATNRAYGLKVKGAEAERQAQIDNEARIQQQYTNTRQKMLDDIATVNNKQKLTDDEKNDSWTRVKDMITTFGSKAFDGINAEAQASLEIASGLPKGSLTKGIQTLKEQELLGKPGELKEVDGSLYSVTTDAQGNLKATLVVKGTSKSEASLTPGQINTTVNQIAGAFDNEPAVRNFVTVKEGYDFVQNILNKTNPTSTDDQGLVYAFAKAMDPNSAVKEGEYTTVQKYSQSLIEKGWADAKRYVKNVAFLTPEARTNMMATIKSKYDASAQNYQQVYNEYQRQISDAYAGKPRQITDYMGGSGGQDIRKAYEAAGYTESYDDMVKEYGEDAIRQKLQEQGFISP